MPPKYNLTNKVALVTGSSSGIGAAIARQFAQNGAQVVLTGRDAANLAKVADEIRAETGQEPLQVVGDFLDKSFPVKLFQAALAKHGRLDILVNNAGGPSLGDSVTNEHVLEVYDKIMQLNVRTVLELIHLAVPELEKTKGNIINISSIAGLSPVRFLKLLNQNEFSFRFLQVCRGLFHVQGGSGHDHQGDCPRTWAQGDSCQFDQVGHGDFVS